MCPISRTPLTTPTSINYENNKEGAVAVPFARMQILLTLKRQLNLVKICKGLDDKDMTKSSEVVRQWFYGKLFTFFGRCFLHKFWDRTGALFQSLHVTI